MTVLQVGVVSTPDKFIAKIHKNNEIGNDIRVKNAKKVDVPRSFFPRNYERITRCLRAGENDNQLKANHFPPLNYERIMSELRKRNPAHSLARTGGANLKYNMYDWALIATCRKDNK